MIGALRAIAVVGVGIALLALGRLVAMCWRRWQLRFSILDVFVEMGTRGHDLEAVAVEAEWVARKIHRLPMTPPRHRLSPTFRAKIRKTTAELEAQGQALLRAGWLQPIDATFTVGGKTVRLAPPTTVWRLSPAGHAWVQRHVQRRLRKEGRTG